MDNKNNNAHKGGLHEVKKEAFKPENKGAQKKEAAKGEEKEEEEHKHGKMADCGCKYF